MRSYNLRDLTNIAQYNKFNRDTLEKVLRLSELLTLFNENEELKGKYVLKGGTAFNLCLFDFPRLSVDIDMNFNFNSSKEEMLEMRELHRKLISAFVALDGYTIDPKSRFTFTLDSYLLKYTNAAGSRDNIKIELNYSNRIQILEPVNYKLSSKIIDNESILALNKVELYGSKIAALIGRTTARDVFDVFQLVNNQILLDNELDILKKCSIFYLLTSNEFQPFGDLLNQFKKNMENLSFSAIKRNLIPLLHVGERIDTDAFKQTVSQFIETLFELTETEQKYIDSFNAGEFKPELLFDKAIADRLKEHPMVLWKMMNHK
ncbi:MAG: nucleotidyl transferase AbiEii/AbiGii toxin family protein [Candidatus Izemoplasmatales bacterium]|nr:nucleotidyl transferase AbiEii/AbiGii toxin family protein [Candidatus Izemoplasmatales bacterium]NLF48073.1 nucleotidyl transferase AbiEii/AbiGii toxin family protein [Acholeplasmataceae bacterium]